MVIKQKQILISKKRINQLMKENYKKKIKGKTNTVVINKDSSITNMTLVEDQEYLNKMKNYKELFKQVYNNTNEQTEQTVFICF